MKIMLPAFVVTLYLTIATITYSIKNPHLTQTQVLLHLRDALLFRNPP